MADSLESMRELAECPICFEVPRNGVMLICKNSHNICEACKAELDRAKGNQTATCPSGQCGYDDPPRRNRTVADIIENSPFEFSCKHFKINDPTSCAFKGTKSLLESHDFECEHRPVRCPFGSCTELVPAKKVLEHYKSMHQAKIYETNDYAVNVPFMWKKELSSSTRSFDWIPFAITSPAGSTFASARLENGEVYVFLRMLSHIGETKKLRCQVSLNKDGHSIDFTAPVYPIDWTKEMICQDKECASFSSWLIETMKEDPSEAGLNVLFNVVKNSD